MSNPTKPWHFAAALIVFAGSLAAHHVLIRAEKATHLEKHKTNDLRDRRLQLLELIYVQPSAARIRAEAAEEFIEIERARGVVPNLREAPLRTLDLRGCDFHGVDLREATLTDADLTGAKLSQAILVGASLWNATLRDADLTGADLSGANLKNSDVTQSQLDAASGDHSTELSSLLKRPSHWSTR